ncbi:MAG: CbbQ/NirQ/NorQ/GpvN family protein [Hyphomicrobiales bacterium]
MSLKQFTIDAEPFYAPAANEVDYFQAAYEERVPILLKGPTGCGKTRFVEHMAWRMQRPLISVSCHDDMTAADLVGRYLLEGGETVWKDGPLTQAVREGAICYLDEIVEARQDTTVVIHPLTDDRRALHLEKKNELVPAHPDFFLVISYNPGYQSVVKDLKESTKQRFAALDFAHADPELETKIIIREAGVSNDIAAQLVRIATVSRNLSNNGLEEGASTRTLIRAGKLISRGIPVADACDMAIIVPLTDDVHVRTALRSAVAACI